MDTKILLKQLEDMASEYHTFLNQSKYDDAPDVISDSKVQQMITRTIAAIERATGRNSVYFEQTKSVLASNMHSWGQLAALIGISESLNHYFPNQTPTPTQPLFL